MGGHKAGEVASQFVTYELQKRFEDENLIEIHQAESWLRSNIKDINFHLYNYAQENPDYHGMGTTLVCAIVYDKQVVVANVGDSRAYVINQRQIEQITSDHSFVNHLVVTGQISKEEALIIHKEISSLKLWGLTNACHLIYLLKELTFMTSCY